MKVIIQNTIEQLNECWAAEQTEEQQYVEKTQEQLKQLIEKPFWLRQIKMFLNHSGSEDGRAYRHLCEEMNDYIANIGRYLELAANICDAKSHEDVQGALCDAEWPY